MNEHYSFAWERTLSLLENFLRFAWGVLHESVEIEVMHTAKSFWGTASKEIE